MFNVYEVTNLSIQNNVTKSRGKCLKKYVKTRGRIFSLYLIQGVSPCLYKPAIEHRQENKFNQQTHTYTHTQALFLKTKI